MARRPNHINVEWETLPQENFTWEQVIVEVLMDVRAELQSIRSILQCPTTQRIPRYLARIASNTNGQKALRSGRGNTRKRRRKVDG